MARLNINVGTNANDGTGDDLRLAMQKINTNFEELYSASGGGSGLVISGNNLAAQRSNDDVVLVPSGTGGVRLPAILFDDNNIIGTRSNEDLVITTSGTGSLVLGALRINGTTVSSDDSSKITLAESVDITGTLTAAIFQVNELSSSDSSAIQINDGLNVSGVLSADSIDVNEISSVDSSAIQVNDNLNVLGTLVANSFVTNTIISTESSAIQIVDGLNVSGELTANSTFVANGAITANGTLTANTIVTNDISSSDSTAIQINDSINVSGTGLFQTDLLTNATKIRLGNASGQTNQGTSAVAIGNSSGSVNQGSAAIAIGTSAGNSGQGNNAIAIGESAGTTAQHSFSIILNASGSSVDSVGASRFYVRPIRQANDGGRLLTYNGTDFEILQHDGLQISGNTISAANTNDDLELSGAGTGSVKLNGLRFPAADGLSGQVLSTDGSGQLQFITPSGGGSGGSLLIFVGDDSTGTVLNSDRTFAFLGAQNISTAVSGDSLTITGPNLTNYVQKTDTGIIVVGDDSSGTSFNVGETLKLAGTQNITTAVSGDTVTITGPNLTNYAQKNETSVTVVGDDSTGTAFTFGETLKVAGAQNITTAVAGDVLTITGSKNIDVNEISSADSSAIQINDGVNVSGTLTANTFVTNNISSSESTAIEVNDSMSVQGTLTANTLVTNEISSSESSAIQINDAVNISGTLTAGNITNNSLVTNEISSSDSTAIQINDAVNISGTLTSANINNSTLTTNEISSADSTAIQINDAVNISGAMTANTIVTNDISSSDSTEIQINDGLNVSGTLTTTSLQTNSISSPDSSAVTVNDNLEVKSQLFVNTISSNDSSAVQILDNVECSANLFANDLTCQVVTVGSSGSPVSTNQSLDMTAGRTFEVYLNASITLTLNNFTFSTVKFIYISNTSATTRTVTFGGTYSTGGAISYSFNAAANSQYIVQFLGGKASLFGSESKIGSYVSEIQEQVLSGISGSFTVTLDGSNYFKISISGDTVLNIPNGEAGVYYYRVTNSTASSRTLSVQVGGVTKLQTFTLSANGSFTPIGTGPMLSASYDFTGYVLITDTGDSVVTGQPIYQP